MPLRRNISACAAAVSLTLLLGACTTAGAADSAPASTTTPTLTSTTGLPSTTTTMPAPTTVPPVTTPDVDEDTTQIELDEIELVEEWPPATTGEQTVLVDVAGVTRSYRLVLPEGASGPMPLVIDLHGFTSNPENHDRLSGWSDLVDRERIVLAQPQGLGAIPSWGVAPDSAAAGRDRELIATIISTVGAMGLRDDDRIYISGFSNGGGMAYQVACSMADIVAAVGTVAGAYFSSDQCHPSGPVPVITFHGTDDIIVPYDGSDTLVPAIPTWAADWAEWNGCGEVPTRDRIAEDAVRDAWTLCADDADVVLVTIEGGSHTWPGTASPGLFAGTTEVSATEMMWDFFSSLPRS